MKPYERPSWVYEQEGEQSELWMRFSEETRNRWWAIHGVEPVLSSEDRSLILGARTGKIEKMENALKAGADFNAVDRGMSPLMHAIERGRYAAAEYLIEYGGDLSFINQFGECALDFATHNEAVFDLLIRKGADSFFTHGRYLSPEDARVTALVQQQEGEVIPVKSPGQLTERRARDYQNLLKRLANAFAVEFTPASPQVIDQLKELGLTGFITDFFQQFDPERSVENGEGVALLTASDLVYACTNSRTARFGLIDIASLISGDSFCLDLSASESGDEPPIVFINHEKSPEDAVASKRRVANSLYSFLELFLGEEVKPDLYE